MKIRTYNKDILEYSSGQGSKRTRADQRHLIGKMQEKDLTRRLHEKDPASKVPRDCHACTHYSEPLRVTDIWKEQF